MRKMDLDSQNQTNVQTDGFSDRTRNYNCFGTLEIEGEGIYYIFLQQNRTANTWILTEQTILDNKNASQTEKMEKVIAIIKVKNTGRIEGIGKTYILTRLMSNLSTMVYLCINNSGIDSGFVTRGEYSDANSSSYLKFEVFMSTKYYTRIDMVYEGFRLSINQYRQKMPIRIPKMDPVIDNVSKAAIVTNLGIKTAAALFKSMGDRLAWFKSKNYILVDSDEKFHHMMLNFLKNVQSAHDANKTVLVGLDTETTGLHMLDLLPTNPLRDNVVAIPFAWKDNEAYLICTDMYYFSNVSNEEIYPLFTTLFSRNPDFSFQDIELDYCDEHFSFNRKNITIAGWNVMFDEQAFFTEGCNVFFDEDGRQIYFNLNTDLQQGQAGFEEWGTFQISNSLKMQTRRMIGDETLELEELFGHGNEDKFRYLQDPVLANLYGGADADYTRQVVRLGLKLLDKQLYAQYRKYDMSLIYMMAKAAWKGMPVNSEEVKNLGALVYKDLETLKDFVYHYAWLANRDTLKNKTDQLCEVLGLNSEVEVEELIDKEKMFRYPFTPANHKKLMFQLLGYPIVKRSEKSGEPALDKFVLQKLMVPQRENPVEIMLEDVMSESDPTMKLVDKDAFNRDKYPLARVFSTYATLNKEYTAYYKPIEEHDTEGRMFYDFTLARAATRRILSPGQTMKKELKKFVIAPPGKLFMSFDASQIEYRHMASLAYIRTMRLLKQAHPKDWERRLNQTSIAQIHAMMQKEEADYHIETAASMTGKRQHEVTSNERKRYKSLGFGIPYGLGERSMCESLHRGVVNDQTLKETKEILADYKIKQKEIIDLLESTRDSAFVPANISDEYRKYLGVGDSHVGIVHNFVGFYRVFILENLTRQRTGRIRRQAGNCIIQGGAAELFRRMLYNFHIGCCRVGIQDKIQWVMTVHDELDAIIDADIDIMLLIKVLYENCTLRYEDHIPYYIGINFGKNWYDAKADANELPVIMVQRMIKAYDAGKFSIPSDGSQHTNLLVLKRHYMCDRVLEELRNIFPNISSGFEWTDDRVAEVDANFENYVVRAYLDVFCNEKNPSLKNLLEGWQKAREEYGFNVNFLQTRFESSDEVENYDFDFDSDFDLSIDLLENSSEEESFRKPEESIWYNESSLFDSNAKQEDIIVSSEGDSYIFSSANNSTTDLIENPNPTSAFDVFIETHYRRTRVLKMSDGVYSVLLAGTRFESTEKQIGCAIKKQFSEGTDTIIIIGKSMMKVSLVAASEEDLDWLDKLVVGKESVAG